MTGPIERPFANDPNGAYFPEAAVFPKPVRTDNINMYRLMCTARPYTDRREQILKVDVRNEYGTLRSTIMASVSNYFHHEPINSTQEKFFRRSHPDRDRMVSEQKAFADVLEKYSVEILWADTLKDRPLQVHARDASFAIGDKLVISGMRAPIRKGEDKGLERILSGITSPVVRAHRGCVEGGDILVDGKRIFVGLGQRTEAEALSWLISEFGKQYDIVPVHLKKGILHLDTVFNIISNGKAVIFVDGIFKRDAELLKEIFDTVCVTKKEQFSMGTNILSINPDVVVAQPSNELSVRMFRDIGLYVETVDYSEIAKLGGGFRCSTCPLVRE